jgi:hypothetical protein
MKKIYLLLLLCSISIVGIGQVVVNQGFENAGSLPTGWTLANSGGYNWSVVNATTNPYAPNSSYGGLTASHGGTYWMDFNSYSIMSGNYGLLISPVVDWSTRASVATTVTAWIWRDANLCSGVGDYIQVYVNTASNLTGAVSMGTVPRWAGTAISGGVTGTSTTGTSGWYQYTFTVPTTYNSNTNYLIFKAYSAYGANSNMDDVSYTTYPCANSAITGNTGPFCGGSTLALSDATTGGTWSSASTGVATVNSTSGLVTGVGPGTAVITNTSSCGTAVTTTVTVNAGPSAPTGNTPFCQGNTITLADGAGTGTWASGATGIATVNSTTGVVTGVTGGSGGTAPITFTLTSSGCSTAVTVTVNPTPTLSTGAVCPGASTLTLSGSPSGGTFSSASTGVATINSSTGVVTGVSAGTSLISYTSPAGCSTTNTITVNSLPSVPGGSTPFCSGSTITLTDASGTGTWASGATSIATVVGTTGVVTGVANGTAPVSFTLTSTGCTNFTTVTVNATAPITGGSSACLGTTTALSDATTGGTWSSSAPSTASVNSSGVVTGVAYGTATITYTSSATGCVATELFSVTTPPSTFAMTGGGAFCSGSTGVHVGLNNSNPGVSYTLYNGGISTGSTLSGGTTGGALDFGVITTPGTYTVIANPGSACAVTQYGTAVVTINPLPTAFSLTGGGGYCTGGTGATVGLSSSTIGVGYQLLVGGTAVGSAVLGTGGAISFGAQTTAGTYTVFATNSVTSCTNTMAGSVTVSLNPLPAVFSMTGGGGYCLGGSGVSVGLSSSVSGFSYQLYQNGVPFGTPFAGTGAAIPFGTETSASGATNYTVVATNNATGCADNMSGVATVTLNTLPPVFTVTGGGAYCLGGTGVTVSLAGSTVGVTYQLYNGTTAVGAPLSGTGVLLPFGLQTGSGSYTVVAQNATTGCVNNMFGSAAVTITPLPNVYSITGGGGYCAGTSGIAVGLSSSTSSVTYSLYSNTGLIGSVIGTGSAISFGLETLAGTYNVIATNTTTTCSANMSGTTIVTINPLPVSTYSVTGGGAYCAGGTGVAVGLSSSTTGINYQLFNGSTAIGLPQAGSGGAVNFGLQTTGGSYTVVGTNISTTCSSNMTGSASVTVNALPASYGLTGGGGYCAGSTPVHVGLSNSNTGIAYQLYNNTGSGPVAIGTALAGVGGAIDFGTEAAAGSYTVIATNTVTACTSAMSGISLVSVNTLPAAFAVTSTGTSYCFGSAGITYNLGGSATGVSYQLLNGTTSVGGPVAGTGAALSFGPYTGAGTYTITGINNTTGCSNPMTGSFTVSVNPLPAVYSITGGGIICSGSGTHVGMGSSAAAGSGITYQLYNSGSPVGVGAPATGTTIDFGLETAAGTYTVVATNGVTGCQNNMAGIAVISVNALPATFNISGGGSYCTGTTGVHVGLLGSVIGYNYQLYVGSTPVAAPMTGTGSAIDFGTETTAGTYTVVATNSTTGCTRTMTGTTTVVINPLPTIHNVTGGGGYCHGGIGDSIGLNIADAGVSYRLYNGTAAVGTAITGAGSAISFGAWATPGTYTIVATNTTTGCTSNMSGSAAVSVFSLPLTFNVTGGGAYCAGGTGVAVRLSSSTLGVNYQLYDGSSAMGTLPGTGIALNFGLETTAGSYTVIATNSTTGCTNTMFGSANVVINALPALHTVGGGGSYCSAGTGLPISLDNSDLGIHYQLLDGGVAVPGAVVIGTGFPVSFAAQTAAGTYTVVGSNLSTTCTNTMTGSATINVIALPAPFTVSGGGHYCSGTGGTTITLSGSETTSTYQLYNGGTPSGSSIAGTGGPLTFTSVTGAGTYTIVATNAATTCNNVMTGTATVVIDPLPTQYIVSGGGAYCAGGTGVPVTLTGSNTGVSYQLMNGSAPTGTPVAGTGFAITFGSQTAAGTYTIMATNGTTACVNNMSSSVNVSINPLPARYSTLSVGSNYCAGGVGIPVSLSNSDAGISYQLYDGSTSAGTAVAGTGSGITFGYQTAAGVYRIIAENPATGCMDTMSSTASVVIDPLPATYSITGGGTYCLGAAGDHIGLSNSNTGITYALYHNSVYTGTTLSGLGTALDFGIETTAGAYTVVATNTATTCTSNMSGIAIVSVNPVPAAYTILGGGPYCAGGSGSDISLTSSTLDVDYQVWTGGVISGAPVAGTGAFLDLGPRTAAGTYSIIATNTLTGCSSTMTGTVAISINPLPTVYSVSGGGGFCPGAAGVLVGISGSQSGISYQLYNGSTATGGALLGSSTSGALSFGLQDSAGSYTVIATNSATGCTNTMSGSATVVINPLPTVYNVTGGGSYCAGTAGVHIGLSSSASDVSYTLYNTTTSTTIGSFPGGSGTPLDFGLQTAAGTYTVSATNTTTTCGSNMAGSAVIVVNPIVVPTVSIDDSRHSDTLCSGSFTTFSAITTNAGGSPSYSWTVNGHTASGTATYSYIPANGDVIGVTLVSSATCATPPSVSNSITLTVLPQEDPTVSVSSNHGLQLCLGTLATFTADPGYGGTDATYQWFVDGHVIGGATTATYGYTPANGDNVYVIMTSNYVCRLSNTITSTPLHIEVDSPAIPVVTIVANPSNHISTGETVNFDVTLVNGSSSPTYQWSVNHIPIGGATGSTFSYNDFYNLDSVTCQVTTGGGCAGLVGFNSIAMFVSNVGVKQVNAANSDVKLIPNPNKGTFSISGTLGTTVNEEVTIEITDMIGQVIYTTKTMSQNGAIDQKIQLGNNIANGMYLLSLHSESTNQVYHLVIAQ